jgi:hypothetical protein
VRGDRRHEEEEEEEEAAPVRVLRPSYQRVLCGAKVGWLLQPAGRGDDDVVENWKWHMPMP